MAFVRRSTWTPTPGRLVSSSSLIGGMRSLVGAVVGGYLLALIDVSLNYSLSQHLLHFRDAFTFTFVILILLFRPSGLIKGREAGMR